MLDPETGQISKIPSQMMHFGVLTQAAMVKVAGLSVNDLPRAGTFWPPANLSQISTFLNVDILYTNRSEILC